MVLPQPPGCPWCHGLTWHFVATSRAPGDVALMAWARRGLTVAVKCNGTDGADDAAIDNERRLYELLLTNPQAFSALPGRS